MKYLLFILLAVSVHAQTNTIWGFYGDFTLQPNAGQVQLTSTDPQPRMINGIIVNDFYPAIPFTATGIFTITNLRAGNYQAAFDSGLLVPFAVQTNTFGSNNMANLGQFAYALPAPYIILNGQTTVFYQLTNGPGITFTNTATNVINGYTNITLMIRTN